MDRYNFRSIGYFLKVADTLNFSQAADELYITQPALSKCIKQLEDEIGITLFHRSTKKVELTPGGKLLYEEWSVWHDRSEEILHQARLLNGKGASKIRIGILEFGGVMNKVIPIVEAYDEAHPEFEIDFEILGYTDLKKHLLNGDLDLIITLNTEIGEHSTGMHIRKLLDLQLCIIVPKKNHLYEKDSLDFIDIKDETFCIFNDTYSDAARNKIIAHCKQYGFTPQKIKYYSNMRSMELSITHSDYITMGYDAFFDSTKDLKFFPTPDLIDAPNLVFAWKGELRKSTTELLNHLQHELEGKTI